MRTSLNVFVAENIIAVSFCSLCIYSWSTRLLKMFQNACLPRKKWVQALVCLYVCTQKRSCMEEVNASISSMWWVSCSGNGNSIIIARHYNVAQWLLLNLSRMAMLCSPCGCGTGVPKWWQSFRFGFDEWICSILLAFMPFAPLRSLNRKKVRKWEQKGTWRRTFQSGLMTVKYWNVFSSGFRLNCISHGITCEVWSSD